MWSAVQTCCREKAVFLPTMRRSCNGGDFMTDTEHDYAYIKTYEEWDDYEGSYDVYECSNCGEYLADSLQIALYGKGIPRICPNCRKELRW